VLKQILNLSIAIARAQLKEIHEGRYLGILWFFISPLFLMLILLAVFLSVFSPRIGIDIAYYPLYLILGIIMFNYFRIITIASTNILINYRNLIKSIKFPYITLVLSVTLRMLFMHITEMVIFLVFLLFFDIPLINILYYPIILIFLVFFSLGVSLMLAAISVFFLDLQNLWEGITYVLWFVTPIFYSLNNSEWLYFANLANPIYYFISIARDLIIYRTTPPIWMIMVALIYTVLSFLIGLLIFNKLKEKFTEKF